MKRVLCVWLPNWPRQCLNGGLEASAAGPPQGGEALLRLAAWCEQFSPSVGLEQSDAPESLLLDATGLGPLFHGEEGLVDHVAREFLRRGLVAHTALADTIGAAWALAHYAAPCAARGTARDETREMSRGHSLGTSQPVIVAAGQTMAALECLPVEALRLSPESVQTLKELGLRRIGQLSSLPRAGLASRFGPELLRRLDQASGEAAEVIVVHRPPPEVQVESASGGFEAPTARNELVQQALQQQLVRLTGELAAQCRGVQQLECRLQCQTVAGLAGRHVSVGLFRPSAEPRHLSELVQMQLEPLSLPGPVSAIQVLVTAAAPLEYRQQELFDGDHRPDPWALAVLIDRLSSRLGRESVLRARLLPEAQPEYAWRYEPLVTSPRRILGNVERKGTGRSRNRRNSGPVHKPACSAPPAASLSRPLRLLPRPLPVSVVSIVPDGPPLVLRCSGRESAAADLRRVWGPERIETGWWRGQLIRRDYYRVETASGEWFWLFRQLDKGCWFLQGEFA